MPSALDLTQDTINAAVRSFCENKLTIADLEAMGFNHFSKTMAYLTRTEKINIPANPVDDDNDTARRARLYAEHHILAFVAKARFKHRMLARVKAYHDAGLEAPISAYVRQKSDQ
jgi:hypothetical protein